FTTASPLAPMCLSALVRAEMDISHLPPRLGATSAHARNPTHLREPSNPQIDFQLRAYSSLFSALIPPLHFNAGFVVPLCVRTRTKLPMNRSFPTKTILHKRRNSRRKKYQNPQKERYSANELPWDSLSPSDGERLRVRGFSCGRFMERVVSLLRR